MDPIMGTTPPHVDYSVTIGGDGNISLVGKSTGMLGPIPRGSTTLVAPPQYAGKC